MIYIRPVESEDLASIYKLSKLASFGLTTLPPDKDLLAERIKASQQAFHLKAGKPQGEAYLFSLVDSKSNRVLGVSGIVSKVGGFEPFYAYRLEKTKHSSQELGIKKEIEVLHLTRVHNGPSEVGSLLLLPSERGKGQGRLLSLSRFLFMADQASHFDPQVIAEMRGVIDNKGRSPFWEAVGRKFFDIDFPEADQLSMKSKRFIGELMPTHPLYLPLLPAAARKVIAKVHTMTEPALRLLKSEGFHFSGLVDIFEAGPVMTTKLENIRSVCESECQVITSITKRKLNSSPFLLSNRKWDYRACISEISILPGKGLEIPFATAKILGLSKGDTLRFLTLKRSVT